MEQKGQIIIEKPWYGWGVDLSTNSTFNVNANTHAVDTFDGTYTQSVSMMLNRPGFEGHIAPGLVFNAMTDAGGYVNAMPMNAVVTSGGTAFTYLANSNLINFPVNSTTIPNGAASSHSVSATGVHSGHTNFTGINGDLSYFSFTVSGTSSSYATLSDEYLFYSWEDNTDGDVGLLKTKSNSYTDNYFSGRSTLQNGTTLFLGVPHPVAIGQDNKVYVGNGRWLAQHDPTTSTVNYQAFDAGPTWTIQGIVPYTNYAVAILAYRTNTNLATTGAAKGEVRMYVWDGFSPTWNFVYPVKENYASNIFNEGSDIYILAQGRNATTKLKKFNGTAFDTIYESGKIGNTPSGTNGTSPMPGAIDIWENHMVWTSGNQGNINAWGSPSGLTANYYSPTGNEMPQGFHQIGLPGVASNLGNGMCKNLIGNTLFIGNVSGGGSTYTIQQSDLTKFDTQAKFRSRLYELPTNSQLDSVQFWFSQFGTGASIQAAIIKDYNTEQFGGGTDQLQLTIDTTTTTGSTMYYQASPFVGDNSNFNAFYLSLSWQHVLTTNTAAIVRKIAINYKYDDDVV